MKKAFLIILLTGLFLPSAALGYKTFEEDGKTVIYEGLVPCGVGVCVINTTNPTFVNSVIETLKGHREKWPNLTFEYQCKNIIPLDNDRWRPAKNNPCQLCHLFVMAKGIIDFVLVYIVFPIATLLLILGGVMFFLYVENPKKVEEAKTLLTSVIIGLLIIFTAWLFINTFFMAIGVQEWTGLKKGWFKINCPIAPPHQ